MSKKYLMLLLAANIYAQEKNSANQNQTPANASQNQQEDDDDFDGQVVLANVAHMLTNLGTITTDPYNPAVVGPGLAQIGVGFINIIAQIFKSMPQDQEITREHIASYFNNLPDETKVELTQLVMVYADLYRTIGALAIECDK